MRNLRFILCWVAFMGAPSWAEIIVSEASIKAPLPGRSMTAAYMLLSNIGERDVSLTYVSADEARSIEMHQSSQVDGVSQMRQREQVLIPAGKSVRFESGGLHLMVFGIKASTRKTIDIQLCFDDDSSQINRFNVESW